MQADADSRRNTGRSRGLCAGRFSRHLGLYALSPRRAAFACDKESTAYATRTVASATPSAPRVGRPTHCGDSRNRSRRLACAPHPRHAGLRRQARAFVARARRAVASGGAPRGNRGSHYWVRVGTRRKGGVSARTANRTRYRHRTPTIRCGGRATARPSYIDVADRFSALQPRLDAAGFEAQRPFTRMVRGGKAAPGDAATVIAVAGPELG